MSDNGIKAEEDRLQDREEGGDDEVRFLLLQDMTEGELDYLFILGLHVLA